MNIMRNVDNIGCEYQSRDTTKQDEMNSRLGERGMMREAQFIQVEMDHYKIMVLDMTPLSTRVISKKK